MARPYVAAAVPDVTVEVPDGRTCAAAAVAVDVMLVRLFWQGVEPSFGQHPLPPRVGHVPLRPFGDVAVNADRDVARRAEHPAYGPVAHLAVVVDDQHAQGGFGTRAAARGARILAVGQELFKVSAGQPVCLMAARRVMGKRSLLRTSHVTSLSHVLPSSQVTTSIVPMVSDVHHLVGSAEIGRMLGVGRQRVQQLINRDDFPKPEVVLDMGKVWKREDVESWARDHGRALADDEQA